MTSVWRDDRPDLPDDALPEDGHLEVLVVGAGLTGLTTAVLLARAGRRVGVVEARTAGAVTTGSSTAKVSLLQGTTLSSMLKQQARPVASAYVEANRIGQHWLLDFCAEHAVPVQRRDAVTFAASPGERAQVDKEHRAARSVGLDVAWHDRLPTPFPVHGATVLADQAQVDPMDVVAALVQELRAQGGTLHQGRRVETVSLREPLTLTLDDGTELTAGDVVLATGTPVLDRGLFFAKLEPMRSYGLAFSGTVPPEGMYLSAGSSSRSVRDIPGTAHGDLLLVGGSGHVVGRTRSEAAHLDRLREWTAEHFPGAVETHAWSAQDYQSYDRLPYVGRLPRGGGRILVGTGYAKWGMTNAVAAGLALSGQVLGARPAWSGFLERHTVHARAGAELTRINLGVGVAGARALLAAETRSAPPRPDEDTGAVGRGPVGVPAGSATVEGRTCRVVGICTHLGGVLHWNDAERSWDCPLHGSRFAPDGEVLEGPATRPLRRL
jgi:glycine/D-amino acid oxidase-like deaminating enzyme/nitrite reductase/ring-hydroxylating ferredoxin subunit